MLYPLILVVLIMFVALLFGMACFVAGVTIPLSVFGLTIKELNDKMNEIS